MNDTISNTVAEVKAAVAPQTSISFKSTKAIEAQPIRNEEGFPELDATGKPTFDEAGTALIAAGFTYDLAKGWKRPTITVSLPAVSEEDVIKALQEGGQAKQFLMAIANDAVYNEARNKINALISANPSCIITAATVAEFDISMEAVAAAYMEESNSAKASGISKEMWAEFVLDYIATMEIALPDNPAEKTANAADHLKLRGVKCQSNLKMLTKLQTYLALWYANTARASEFAGIFTSVDKALTTYLGRKAEDSI